ncbi:MAG: metal ABC transporter permease [Candidatus Wildermuthbacteria bacterium]|nr:metal ABC transporter permease [Candidatus Wildermuthbacteria bacterium]
MISFDQTLLLALASGSFIGAAAGYLGSFMVLRRMALVGDALSHVALPGIAIALLLEINPFIGAFLFLFVAALAIWGIEEKTKLPTEALVGVFFTLSLAIGVLITPEPELLEALFGNIEGVGIFDALMGIVLAITVFAIAYLIKKGLLLGIVSRDLAESSRIPTRLINLIFLLLVTTVVALGVKVVGTLLMGAMVVVPAVAAKNFSHQFGAFSFLSVLFGTASVVGGIILANLYNLSPGPVIVLVSVMFFVISLIARLVRKG